MKDKKLIFSQRIKELRLEKGLTQGKLAEILNIDVSSVGKYELNLRTPTIYTFNDMANYFNVSVDYLIGREDI